MSRQRLTAVQWCALLLLALGMANTTQGGSGGGGGGGPHAAASAHQLRGITTLVLNGCLSGLSTVLNEWLIKFQDPRAPLMFATAIRTEGLATADLCRC
jgi:drug/metabolite transporter (DMT)-like permease